jgi:hypothetical protein
MIVLIVEAVAFQTSMVATNRDWQMDIVASNEDARQRLAEGLVLSNATVSSSEAKLTFTNMGSIVAYVHHIWVISINDSSIHTSFTLPSLVSVAPREIVPCNLSTSPWTLNASKSYYFKAVTTRGNIAEIRYPLASATTTTTGTTSSTTIGTTSYTTVSTTSSTTSYTTVSTTSYTTTSTTISTTSYTTLSTTSSTTSYTTTSTTSYTTVSTTSSTTSYTTVSTTSSTTLSTTSYTTTSTTISTTSYTTVSTTSYTTISTTSYTTINNNSPNMISGTLMIAYQAKDAQGYNSGPSDSCHQELPLTLTGISGIQTGSTLYFLDPWLTDAVLTSARNDQGTQHTAMYYLVNATNTMSTSIVPSAGTIDLTWYGSNHIDGSLLGIYYNPGTGWQFYIAAKAPTIPSGREFYAIYQTNYVELSSQMTGNVFFIGSAAITNTAKNTAYYSAQLAIDGLWVRSTCS